jgi:hypothetical protein
MRYLVTTELETSFLLKVKRFFRLARPRKEYFKDLVHSDWYPDDLLYGGYMEAREKIIKQAKQRLVWKQ